MRYNVVKKEVLANGPYSIDAENYLKYEMKRRIVLDMIDKLPFEIYEKQLQFGVEYTVALDVEIQKLDEYLQSIAQLLNYNQNIMNLYLNDDIEYQHNERDNNDSLND